LERKDCKDIFIPKRKDYDLRSLNAVKKMYEVARADIVIHLATVIGGIGTNRANPAIFFHIRKGKLLRQCKDGVIL